MAADRSDNEIKGDIISELEDLDYLDTGVCLLDAFVVERVQVAQGRADIQLVFDDDVPEASREEVAAQVRAATHDIEGLFLVVLDLTTRGAIAAAEPNLVFPRPPGDAEAQLAASIPPGAIAAEEDMIPTWTPPAPAAGQLSLSALLAVAAEGVPPEEIEAPGFALPTPAAEEGVNLYSGGGGCAVGTSLEVLKEAAQAAAAAPQPAPTPAPTPAPAPAPVAPQAGVAAGMVQLSLERYTALIQAEARLVLLERLIRG